MQKNNLPPYARMTLNYSNVGYFAEPMSEPGNSVSQQILLHHAIDCFQYATLCLDIHQKKIFA